MGDGMGTAGGKCPFKSRAEFDPLADDFVHNPWNVLKKLQGETPVFYAESIGYWVITKYSDIRACFLNTNDFSAAIALEPVTPLTPETMESLAVSGFRPAPVMVNEDGAIHKSRRNRFQRHFDVRRSTTLEPFIRQSVNEYIDRVVKLGKADLMRDVIYDVPLLVAFKVLGLPVDDIAAVKKMGEGLAQFMFGAPNAAQQKEAAEQLGKYWSYAAENLEYKRNHLADDFISESIRAQLEEGEHVWSNDHLTFLVLNATNAAHETTTNATGNAVMNLLSERHLWKDLVANPSKIEGAVNELLRVGPSSFAHRRQALVDVEIGGVKIPAGSKILMYLAAANRDPAIFESPDEINLEREDAVRALTFGYGAHQCLGQYLAKLEMRVILEELLRRLPYVRLVPQHFSFAPATVMARGPAHIFVEWDPTQNPVPEDRP